MYVGTSFKTRDLDLDRFERIEASKLRGYRPNQGFDGLLPAFENPRWIFEVSS